MRFDIHSTLIADRVVLVVVVTFEVFLNLGYQ
jgi:hypothetical protein